VRELQVEMREEFRALRAEMREGFHDLREEMRGLRERTGNQTGELRAELYSARRWTVNLWATTVLGFVALLIQTSLR
jgi:sorbitol-specific phosphotransferase system component IIBC